MRHCQFICLSMAEISLTVSSFCFVEVCDCECEKVQKFKDFGSKT